MGLVIKPVFLLFDLTGVTLYYGLQNLALVFTSAANAALISAGVPVAAASRALQTTGKTTGRPDDR